jgi:hypothetical protein
MHTHTHTHILNHTGYCVLPMSMAFMILLVVSQVYELSDVSHFDKNGIPSITESIEELKSLGRPYCVSSKGLMLRR